MRAPLEIGRLMRGENTRFGNLRYYDGVLKQIDLFGIGDRK